MDFRKKSKFSGYLVNPIEVVSGLPQLANWLMDVLLDLRLQSGNDYSNSVQLFNDINDVLQASLYSKIKGEVNFGVDPRGYGSTRVQVVNITDKKSIYPSIFNMSSGEASLLCLFGELIRQVDYCGNKQVCATITGIVLIDEIDKHLHITLQKDVLPALFDLFPNVQFIVTTHSPFIGIGLAQAENRRAKLVDLDTGGVSSDLTKNDLYSEVYEIMIAENDRYKVKYDELESILNKSNVPLIITEGKTDAQHLKRAMKKLKVQDIDVEFHDMEGNWSESQLKAFLEHVSKIPSHRKIIGIFDRDVVKTVEDIEKDGQPYKSFGNDVYAFCIPVPAHRKSYENISIEFFYTDEDLKSEKGGKRLYFDNEISFMASDKRKQKPIKSLAADDSVEFSKKIFDENIGNLAGAHSKSCFASLIENDEEFSENFDFSSFGEIFSVLKSIVNS